MSRFQLHRSVDPTHPAPEDASAKKGLDRRAFIAGAEICANLCFGVATQLGAQLFVIILVTASDRRCMRIGARISVRPRICVCLDAVQCILRRPVEHHHGFPNLPPRLPKGLHWANVSATERLFCFPQGLVFIVAC